MTRTELPIEQGDGWAAGARVRDGLTKWPNANQVRTAIVAPTPMTPRVEAVNYPEGDTIAQLLVRIVETGVLDPQDLERTEVFIDGQMIADREAGLDYQPRAGETVNVVVMPAGGGHGGGNKALQTVLQIAVIAAATFIGGPAAGGATGAKMLALRVAAAAVQIGGTMAINAAFAQKQDGAANESNYALSGQSNQARPRKSMPLVLGQARLTFDVASTAFTTTIGDDVFVTAIYGVHYGPCAVADEKLGETLIAGMAAGEVQLEKFLTPGPRQSALYPMRSPQESYTDEVVFGADWIVHTTFDDAERVEIDIAFPNGLCFNKENGKTLPQEVRGRVEYSPAGENAWVAAPIGAYRDRDGVLITAGDWYVQAKSKKKAVRRTVAFATPEKGKYDVRVKAWDPDGDDPELSNYTTMWTALRTIENRPPVLDETLSIIVARFKATNSVNGVAPAFSGVVTPIAPVLVDGAWTGSPAVYSNAWQPTSNAAALARYMLTGYPAAKPLAGSEIDASFATGYALIEAYDWKGCVLLTDDVSQQDALIRLGFMGRFSTYWNGQAMCLVTDWEKPAPRQVFSGRNVQGYRYRRSFPDEIHGVVMEFDNLDRDGLADELVVYADGYDRNSATILDTFPVPYKAKEDRAYRDGRVWLAKRIHHSEDHSWTAGADALASTFGDRVLVRHASTLFGLGEARVQFRRRTGALISGVRLDSAVTMEDGKTYALDVRRDDQPAIRGLLLTTTPGKVRELLFAMPLAEDDAPMKDDLVVFGETSIITEDVELIDVAPSSSRQVSLSAQPYRYDAIHAAETGPIPPLQTLLTSRASAPQPSILACSGSPDGAVMSFTVSTQRSAPIRGFTARWRSTPTADDPAPAWTTLDMIAADAREARTPAFPDAAHTVGDVEAEYRIDFEIRTVLSNGEISSPATAEGVLIVRGVPTPGNFSAIGVKRIAADGSAYPVIAVSADAVEAGIVQDLVVEMQPQGADPQAWASAGQPLLAANPQGDFPGVKGGSNYDLRAAWRTADGWRSAWVVVANVTVPAGSSVASDVVAVDGELSAALRARITEARARADGAASDARDAALAVVDAVANQAVTDELINRALHTPNGLPLGPTAQEQMVITANSVETIALFAVKTEDGAAVVSTGTTVIIDPATGETRAERDASLLAADGDNYALIAAEEAARIDADEAEAALRLVLQTDFNSNVSTVAATLVTLSNADSALSALITALDSEVGANKASADSSISTLTTATSALSAALTALDSEVDGNKASADSSLSTLTTATSALSSALTALNSEVDGNKADADFALLALADDTSAIASSLLTLNASVDGLDATVTSQGLVIAEHDGRLLAYAKYTAAVGAEEAYIEMVATSDDSLLNLVAKTISLGDVGEPVITVEGGVARISNAIIGGAQIEELTLGTTRLMDNAVQETQVSVGSGPLYGNDTFQDASVTKTITMAFPGIINIVAFGDCIDGGGHSASYHSSGISILLRDVTYDVYYSLNPYEVAGENATSRMPCFGSYEATYAGDFEITLQLKSRPDDYFEQKGIMITRFYK